MHQHGGKDDDATGRKIAHFSECEKNYRSESGGRRDGSCDGRATSSRKLESFTPQACPLSV